MKRVLIVDDEFSIVDSLRELLTWAGYAVSTAANADRGLEELARERPALLILDYMMPGRDGLAMLRELRADPKHAALPVIMMTAAPRALPATGRQWDELLAKPFDVSELLDTIHRLIGPP